MITRRWTRLPAQIPDEVGKGAKMQASQRRPLQSALSGPPLTFRWSEQGSQLHGCLGECVL